MNHKRELGVAIAASIVIAIICGAFLIRHETNPKQIVQKQPAPPTMAEISSPQLPSPIIARPANEYECAILLANSPPRSAPAAVAAKPAVNPPAANPPAQIASSVPKIDPKILVNHALDSKTNSDARGAICSQLLAQNNTAGVDGYLQLVESASTRDAALDALRSTDHPPAQLLIDQLGAPLVSRRYAAARALGCLCHGPTFTVLQQMVEQNDHRQEAMFALLYCPNPAADRYLEQLRGRPVLRQQLQAAQAEMKVF